MPEEESTNERSPLAHRGFRSQLTAVFVSQLGSGVAPLAIAFGVLARDSVGILSALLAASAIGILCTALYGGVLADRLPRTIMAGSMDVVKCASQSISGFLLIHESVSAYWLIPCQLVFGVATGLGGPAQSSLSRDLLRLGQIRSGASYLATAKNVASVAGPLLGGVLVTAWGGGQALLFDAATFLISGSLLLSIKLTPKDVSEAPRQGVVRQTRDALEIVMKERWVLITFAFFFIFSVTFSTTFILGPLLNVGLPHGVSRWSWVMGAIGVGAVSGGLLSFRSSALSPVLGVVLSAALAVPLMLAVAAGWPLPLLLFCGVLAGAGISMANVHWATALQSRLDNKILGRVSSLELIMTLAARPLGYVGAAVLTYLVGSAAGLVAAAGVVLAAGSVAAAVDLVGTRRRSRSASQAETGQELSQ
jgi:MFS family permease